MFFERSVEDPVPKKNSLPKSPPSSGQKCQRINVEAGHNTVSHRLSLLFPKLRLSNFMISSLASAVFVQCPPQCTQLSRQTLPASLPPHRASCWQQPRPHRAGRSGEIMPARQSPGLPKRKSTITVKHIRPRSEPIDHQPCL